jgi:hypothetical protein
MINKEQYIKDFLIKEMNAAIESIEEKKSNLPAILELPDNCYGVMINDSVCKDEDFKKKTLESTYKDIGILTGVYSTSGKILELIKMNDEDFSLFISEQEKVKKHNEEVMKDIFDLMQNN